MKIKLKYFGMVAEITNTSEELIEVDKHSSSTNLVKLLEEKFHSLNQLDYRLAINQELIHENVELKENDTIAVLPAFAGG